MIQLDSAISPLLSPLFFFLELIANWAWQYFFPQGTLVVWAGTLTAAMVAFQLGRGTGQKFVRRLLDAEAGGESEKSVITSKLSDFQV